MGAEYFDERVRRMWVCLYVIIEHISETTHPNFTEFSGHIACTRVSVLLSLHYDSLCTSGSVNDFMFSRNGPYGASDVIGRCKLK